MRVRVLFWSYFRDLAGGDEIMEVLSPGATIAQLLEQLHRRIPRLAALQKSTLIAVGMDYQDKDYVLKDGDEVSLFPPVQGG